MRFEMTKFEFNRRARGFTLIELLVVIGIIALLIGIILPSLSAARKQAQGLKCGANLHDVATAMTSYLADWNGTFPPAYVYPSDTEGNYDFLGQPADHPYGYIHWSWFLYNKGTVDPKAFQCPTYPNGGAPRTNPGPLGTDWEVDQVDQQGNSGSGVVLDAQAPRMAYAGNAAIFPRNKYTTELSAGSRVNVFTQDSKIGDTGKTILITEYNLNWKAVATQEGGGLLSKSHRSINPFMHVSTGSDEYASPPTTPGFTYGDAPYYGLLSKTEVEEATNLINTPGLNEANCVGRHHSGGVTDPYIGGSANFLYADGHVERKSVLQTFQNWEWGTRFYAINGSNKVGPPWIDP